jgi:hypothetical protein
MKKTILTLAVVLSFHGQASASAIVLSGPIAASGLFDVQVSVTNLFAGHDPDDVFYGFGFNAVSSNPQTVFLGATSNPSRFDPATSFPGTNVFAQTPFGGEIAQPFPASLLLATLHFNATGKAPTTISLFTDSLDPFQGLFFAPSDPFDPRFVDPDPISGAITVTAVPEPATLTLLGLGMGVAAVRRRRRG